MTSAIRIRPRVDAVDSALGRVPIAQLDLGGIPRGAVLLLSAGGDFEADAAQHLNELATHGYEGIAADLDAIEGTDGQLVEVVGSLLGHLRRRDWEDEQVGIIGYGLGGHLALLSSARFGLGAAISVSPTTMTTGDDHLSAAMVALASRIRTPWLGMFGEDDPAVTATAGDAPIRLVRDQRLAVEVVHIELLDERLPLVIAHRAEATAVPGGAVALHHEGAHAVGVGVVMRAEGAAAGTPETERRPIVAPFRPVPGEGIGPCGRRCC